MIEPGQSGRAAVLLLAHGTPDRVEEVPDFLLRITGGRVLSLDAIEAVKDRYRAIGRSPLTDITRKQAERLSARLDIPVYVGMRNWHPLIADTLGAMIADGVERAVVICMAPHNSRTSVGLYRHSLRHADPALSFDFVESWHDQPLLIQAFAEKLAEGRRRARDDSGAEPPVIFTAHSVPERTILEGDPYEDQARHTAELVAAAARLATGEWRFAFQSQGFSRGPWLGPTVEETIVDLKHSGQSTIFIQPIGFLSDHVEVLYDIDIAFRQFAESQGLRLWRAESLNDSPLLISALAELAGSRLPPTRATDPPLSL